MTRIYDPRRNIQKEPEKPKPQRVPRPNRKPFYEYQAAFEKKLRRRPLTLDSFNRLFEKFIQEMHDRGFPIDNKRKGNLKVQMKNRATITDAKPDTGANALLKAGTRVVQETGGHDVEGGFGHSPKRATAKRGGVKQRPDPNHQKLKKAAVAILLKTKLNKKGDLTKAVDKLGKSLKGNSIPLNANEISKITDWHMRWLNPRANPSRVRSTVRTYLSARNVKLETASREKSALSKKKKPRPN